VVVSVLGGAAIVFPSLAVLFRLALTGRLGGAAPPERAAMAHATRGRHEDSPPALLGRVAVACLIVGLGLLTVADARWAHAVGVAAFLAFVVTGFLALVPTLLPDSEADAGSPSE
jgi:cytochrome bd ubiquinol oxidase subunit II